MELDKEGGRPKNILAHFKDERGDYAGPPLNLPQDVTSEQLTYLLHQITNQSEQQFSFFVNEEEVTTTVGALVETLGLSTEQAVDIVYRPQALFRVRAVTRCSATIPGHTEAVLSVAYSPDGRRLASGSGDTTVRFWDVGINGPRFTGKEHKSWVLCVSWAPNGMKLASGGKDTEVIIWDPATGQRIGKPLKGHKQYITSLAWQPVHMDPGCVRLASASKDGTVKIWDTLRGVCVMSLARHTQSVTCVLWGGQGLIYTASQDRTVKVWRAEDGALCRSLDGHGHWVNCMALNTAYVLRTGAIGYRETPPQDNDKAQQVAQQRYSAMVETVGGKEILVSGSDDFTMYMWEPANSKTPITRMTGHQQLINHVCFSPNGLLLVSASFDKSVKLWDGRTGKFLSTLRGHVGAVYQVCWSADSRLFASASKDSTMKVWDVKSKKMLVELPGHADEVFTVDWSPDGEKVASGGKDCVLKIWCT